MHGTYHYRHSAMPRPLVAALGVVLALVATACGGGGPRPVGAADQEEVRVAYLDAWAVRDQAVHSGDLSVLARRFADDDPSQVVGNLTPGARSALQLVSDSVSARVQAGVDVRGDIGHQIRSIDLADDAQSAQVVDDITDRTYLVDRVTGIERSSAQETKYQETWFLARRDGVWKVVYFARQT